MLIIFLITICFLFQDGKEYYPRRPAPKNEIENQKKPEGWMIVVFFKLKNIMVWKHDLDLECLENIVFVLAKVIYMFYYKKLD